MMREDIPAETTASVPFRTIAHLYDADDPLPEHRRELSDRAEQLIFREVLDVPKGSRNAICNQLEIILPASDLAPYHSDTVTAAIRSHFHFRSLELRRDMNLTQRVGLREFRLTLAICIPSFIGIALCSQFKGDPLTEVVENILIIFCWVTIWQPFQSLVFDRWTLSESANVYEKIARMDIIVRAA
jgi:hypothetical protein